MYRFIKAFLDYFCSFFGIIFLLPLFLLIAIIVRFSSRGPIIFKQNRVGKNNKTFKIYKFRTMKITAPKDCPTALLDNPYQHITKVGKFLRKTSLDELPQLFNVLSGKMSIVGPRPVVTNEVDLINERNQYDVSNVKPGITGWAQVNGRDELSTHDKALLDAYYVDHLSFKMDTKCFFKTIKQVVTHDGIKEGSQNTTDNNKIKNNSVMQTHAN